MSVLFISHPDFSDLKPLNVFHRELDNPKFERHDTKYNNKHILFRKKFNIKKFKKAILNITADDYYKLYINGEFVTQGPASGYISSYYYNEIDVSKYLIEGENVIAVHTYYQGLINRVWISGDLREMLWCSLKLDDKEVLVSDTTWKCAYHSGYSECGIFGYETQYAEFYDANAREVDFYKKDFDDSNWKYAKEKEYIDYNLVLQPTKQLLIYEEKPSVTKKIDNRIFIDFGHEAVGYLKFNAKGTKNSIITIHFGEELAENDKVRFKLRCNCVYEEKMKLSGKLDVLNEYDYKAFRYVEIILPDEKCEIGDISLIVRHYPFSYEAKYDIHDDKMKDVIKICADTIKYSTQEGYVDCPTREKGQYLGDVSIAARAHAVLTNDTTMMKKAIIDFCRSSFIDKGIMAVSTSSLNQEIADYSLQFSAQICWVYSIDNDIEFVKTTIPYVLGVLDYFKQFLNDDYLLDCVDKWNLVDWPQNLRDGYDMVIDRNNQKGVHNVINAFWYGFLKYTDELLNIAGHEPTGLTEKVALSYIKSFYMPKEGLFKDSLVSTHSAIHSNVLPYLFGLCDKKYETECAKNTIKEFINKKSLASMGVYMAYFTLAALKMNNEYDLAYKLALDERCWINMIKEGGTTTFEAWGKDQKWNTSLNHPWACAPLIIFTDVRPY